MTWIYGLIFIVPFLLVFAVKPEHGIDSKFWSLTGAILLHWILMCVAMQYRMDWIYDTHHQWLYSNAPGTYPLPSDLKEYQMLERFYDKYVAAGWLLGCAITATAELLWRRKYRRRIKELGCRKSRFGTTILILGLPFAVFTIPAGLLMGVASIYSVFTSCYEPSMQLYFTPTKKIACRLSTDPLFGRPDP